MSLPTHINAQAIVEQQLQRQTIDCPRAGAGEVLIKVEAAGVNRPDVMQRQGLYPAPQGASPLPGLEVAGTVVECGAHVSRWQKGDRVCALVNGGGYAEYCVAPAGQVLPIPSGFSAVQAAALPETFFTVWHNVFQRGALQAGETLLVHGGTSGIGTTAIMLARAFGARVMCTAGSDEKCHAALQLGADVAINYRTDDFVARVKAAGGADVILDMVGGDYIARNIKAAAPDGRIVNIAFLSGSKVELDFTPVMLKRLTLTGSTLRARSDETKAALAQALENQVWPLLSNGQITPLIAAELPLAEASAAHELMESSQHIGKIVLTL
ncbi:NAD(P)H-quinone oxidoreductase [uncultured Gilvimarinus sp.]|uniref:NAD(P)H-quinone oxidoreductase n=1 Tax=uncultured Gilvimarinus sp. TaxID=1689143 RepID=UPI0030EC5EAD|tara:strand:- start:369 stop:1343 length:975 start_codon:yes stop_codon:yes gene_type:complete